MLNHYYGLSDDGLRRLAGEPERRRAFRAGAERRRKGPIPAGKTRFLCRWPAGNHPIPVLVMVSYGKLWKVMEGYGNFRAG